MLQAWRTTHTMEAEIEAVLFADWPEADQMMRQLGRFLTAHIPHPSGEPLLQVCWNQAINGYETARLRQETDPRRLLAFAADLLSTAATVVDYRITAWDQVWVPQRGEPLLDWVAIRGNTMSVRPSDDWADHPDWKKVGEWVLGSNLNRLIARAGAVRC